MNGRAPGSIRSARPEPLRKSASQQAYGRRGRARLTHPAHRASTPERTFDVLRRPDIFTCPRQLVLPHGRGCLEPVPFDEPGCVVDLPKDQQRLTEVLDGVEGAHPEQVLLERADEALRSTSGSSTDLAGPCRS